MNTVEPDIHHVLQAPVKDRLLRLPVRIVEAAAALLMAVIAVLVFANATGRYLFSRPLPWTEEIVLNAMIWVAACGVVIAAARGAMMCCDVIVCRLPARHLKMMQVLTAVAGILLLGFFAHVTWQYTALFGKDLSPLLRLPKAIGMFGLLFALIGLALALCVQAYHAIRD
ncbi:TRAP transporter small permease [Roseibium marinum]|uniref:TRAP transporter small permease protein n=1 Tax=Roseibium marinum TaxID=281252 RepID=A0A2S3UTD3_9HYPH|nr:TRAP transporter small permease subunit [Roseibium marinum]POF30946.1 TRAP-type C4-dicarboxylate transport system permease small subunit [Roseibium marinum]